MATEYSLVCWGGATGFTATMTIASPCVVTITNHGLHAGTGVVFTTTGALPTGVVSGTTYYALSTGANTFNLYDTAAHAIAGGATGRVITTGSQSGTHTAKGAYYLGLGSYTRWTDGAVTNIYSGISAWKTARSSLATSLVPEYCEVGEAFTEVITADILLDLVSGATTIASKVNGVRSAAWHGGVFGSGYILSCASGSSYMIFIGSYNVTVDGLELNTTNPTTYGIRINKSSAVVKNNLVKGNLGYGQYGIYGYANDYSVYNNICISLNRGFNFKDNPNQGILCYNNIACKNTFGFEGSGATPYGRYYNNISIGNVTQNWSQTPPGCDGASYNYGDAAVDKPTVTISNATPGSVGYTAHGRVTGSPIIFSVSGGGALPSPLVAGTVYYVKTVTDANNFTIAATKGGAAINTTDAGSGTFYVMNAWDLDNTSGYIDFSTPNNVFTDYTNNNYSPAGSAGTPNAHDDIQTTFAGSTYMQYLIPDSGKILNGLYQFENSWIFVDSTTVGYMTTGGWKDAAGDNLWANIKTVSGDNFTGIQTYYNQTGTPVNFSNTGLVNMILPVRVSASDVAGKSVTVYSRPYGYSYSSFTTTATSDGLIDSFPLSAAVDPQITISQGTVDAYSDLSIKWETVYRSSFDGASTTKYTLNGSHNNSITTITVNETIDAGVAASGTLQIDSEVISYTGKGTNTFTGCTRGQYDTTAASHSALAALSTNTKQYTVLIRTTNSSRRLNETYCWIQSRLTKSTDIDALTGGYIGQLTNALVSYTGTMITKQGVWLEGFSSIDANSITYTDQVGGTHTSPLSVPVIVNVDGSGYQVAVFALDAPGYTDATYTPAHIASTIINTTSASTSVSSSIIYSADVPVKVLVRKSSFQQFSIYTTITNLGLNVTSINGVDSAY